MKESNITDRLTFLAEQFDVFENIDVERTNLKLKELLELGFQGNPILTNSGEVVAINSTRFNEKGRILKKISVASNVFADMVVADPTENKMYLQWMLNTFTRYIKTGSEKEMAQASRFVTEDLPQAKTYLVMFEDNKRKKKFKEL